MTIDKPGTSVPTPNYKNEITVRALTAAGICKSYEFTIVREPSLPVHALVSPVLTLMSLDAAVLVVTLSFHDEFADQVTCSASAGNVSTESIVNRWALCQCASVKLHRLDANIAFLLHACSGTITRREDSTSDVSEVTLSSVGPQPPAPRLGIPLAGVVYISVHITWASNGHSAHNVDPKPF